MNKAFLGWIIHLISSIAIFILLSFFGFLPKTFSATNLVINEFLANPANGQNEWVEIYNPTASDIDLTGWILSDKSGSKKKLDSLGSIFSGGFAVYEYSGDGWLNNTASESKPESITLIDNVGNAVDSYLYKDNQKENSTTGRSPDGSSNWVILASATKGNANSSSVPTDTPTPYPTAKPTPTTSVSKTTPTRSVTNVATSNVPSTQKLAGESGKPLIAAENMPTSVLGESTVAGMTTASTKSGTKSKETKNLSNKENNISKILIGTGLVFIISCAILASRIYRKSQNGNENT